MHQVFALFLAFIVAVNANAGTFLDSLNFCNYKCMRSKGTRGLIDSINQQTQLANEASHQIEESLIAWQHLIQQVVEDEVPLDLACDIGNGMIVNWTPKLDTSEYMFRGPRWNSIRFFYRKMWAAMVKADHAIDKFKLMLDSECNTDDRINAENDLATELNTDDFGLGDVPMYTMVTDPKNPERQVLRPIELD